MDIISSFLRPQDKTLTVNRHLGNLSVCRVACRFCMGYLYTDFFNFLEVTFEFHSLLFYVIFEVIG
jgi:hypothetical protein